VKRFPVAWLAWLTFALPASATTGGDSTVELLGWNDARSTILALRELGGENEIVELVAFNVADGRIDTARCETCAGLVAGARPRDADERAYLQLLRSRPRLQRLVATPAAAWRAAGLRFACTSKQRVDAESGFHFRRQRCRLAAGDGAPTIFEFSAPSEWLSVRLFRAPGHPAVALAWVAHTGIQETGYRENELVISRNFTRRSVSCMSFVRLYAAV